MTLVPKVIDDIGTDLIFEPGHCVLIVRRLLSSLDDVAVL